MKKFSVVLGVAAVATLVGCKDPDYIKGTSTSKNEVRNIETAPKASCKCAPGTKHFEPCKCAADDCKCVVEKRVEVRPAPQPVVKTVPQPVVPAATYTTYIVQRGDYLSKISKKFNIRIDAIRKANPSIKKDVVFVGMKLKLPGNVDVGEQKMPVVKAQPAKKTYTGATKEYVVKNGDTLGAIAYGNGINIRQLKALNNLTSDNLRIGQKLKIPAEKVVKKSAKAPAKAAEANKVNTVVKSETPAPAKKEEEVKKQVAETPAEKTEVLDPAPAEKAADKEEPAAEAATPVADDAASNGDKHETYVVQEGDDMTGVSIRWGVSAAAIRELNNLGEKDQLTPGQILKLPADAQQ